jgi:hypothetical protein
MKLLFLVVVAASLVGCSSPKKSKLVSDQYCHTSQTIEKEDSNISSKTVIKCTDDPVERYVPAKIGIAKDCYTAHIPMLRNGRSIYEKIIVCQKLNGSYDVVEPVRIH